MSPPSSFLGEVSSGHKGQTNEQLERRAGRYKG